MKNKKKRPLVVGDRVVCKLPSNVSRTGTISTMLPESMVEIKVDLPPNLDSDPGNEFWRMAAQFCKRLIKKPAKLSVGDRVAFECNDSECPLNATSHKGVISSLGKQDVFIVVDNGGNYIADRNECRKLKTITFSPGDRVSWIQDDDERKGTVYKPSNLTLADSVLCAQPDEPYAQEWDQVRYRGVVLDPIIHRVKRLKPKKPVLHAVHTKGKKGPTGLSVEIPITFSLLPRRENFITIRDYNRAMNDYYKVPNAKKITELSVEVPMRQPEMPGRGSFEATKAYYDARNGNLPVIPEPFKTTHTITPAEGLHKTVYRGKGPVDLGIKVPLDFKRYGYPFYCPPVEPFPTHHTVEDKPLPPVSEPYKTYHTGSTSVNISKTFEWADGYNEPKKEGLIGSPEDPFFGTDRTVPDDYFKRRAEHAPKIGLWDRWGTFLSSPPSTLFHVVIILTVTLVGTGCAVLVSAILSNH